MEGEVERGLGVYQDDRGVRCYIVWQTERIAIACVLLAGFAWRWRGEGKSRPWRMSIESIRQRLHFQNMTEEVSGINGYN